MAKLLPCPFCGGEPTQSTYPLSAWIECKSCKIAITSYGPESEENKEGQWWCDVLPAKWNHRCKSESQPTPDAVELEAKIEVLERALRGWNVYYFANPTPQIEYLKKETEKALALATSSSKGAV